MYFFHSQCLAEFLCKKNIKMSQLGEGDHDNFPEGDVICHYFVIAISGIVSTKAGSHITYTIYFTYYALPLFICLGVYDSQQEISLQVGFLSIITSSNPGLYMYMRINLFFPSPKCF